MAKENSFGKAEKLTSVKAIKKLFSMGRSYKAAPLAACFCQWHNTKNVKVQILVSASKRIFKHAVDRNRAKRLMREAYRLNKNSFLKQLPEDINLSIAFIYQSYHLTDFKTIENSTKILLAMIVDKYKQQNCTKNSNENQSSSAV